MSKLDPITHFLSLRTITYRSCPLPFSYSLHIISDLSDPSLSSWLNINMWILAKYAVILCVVGMNCNCNGGGALLEQVKTTTLRLLKNPLFAPVKITPRSAHILWLWVTVIIIIKLRWALFVTYTIIQSITSSEMCSLHLTHPSAHTPGAVDSRHCGARGAVGGSVPCSRVLPQSWTIPAGAEIRTHNLGLQVQRSIH